jgi:hypothetical protein
MVLNGVQFVRYEIGLWKEVKLNHKCSRIWIIILKSCCLKRLNLDSKNKNTNLAPYPTFSPT